MPRVLLIGLALIMTSSAAYAAPGSNFTRLSASSERTSSSESQAQPSGLFEQVMSFFQLRASVKGVAAAAPTPSESSTPTSAIKECEEEEVAGKSSKKKEDEKLAKQTGPEPIYLAF